MECVCLCVCDGGGEREREVNVIEKQQSSERDSSGRLCMDSFIIVSTYRDKYMLNVCTHALWCVHVPY